MSEKQFNWYKLADNINEIPFQENKLAEVIVDGKTICLVKREDQIFACTQKCPHAGGHLVEGFIDIHGSIVCPLHRYRFNPETGRNISGEGYFLKTYKVELREDGVYIGFEKSKGLFGW
ncbi:MAG: Rieske (2Fe-2S) protein [Sphingobacteriales bacterium]|nr:Rieske (2Fe-2S) protein [Sphingobacteriales bacterium]MBI3720316.1 Rieske (2Fe-2S) protein [Sphingobacteriales bacterium]